jgi:osmoprotectant transport system ATP-binding protein
MIQFESITKTFKAKQVLSDVSFDVGKGSLVAIIGESGCGKTTLLKMINRLVKPTGGRILIDGTDIRQINEVELRRNIGYVIQQTGLFPHMTVRENIELIPKIQKMPPEMLSKNTRRLMEMVGLDCEEFLERYPTELSGGQQQRIGVARAFATDPEVILMDEPFSALDPLTRSDLQDELMELQSKLKKTIIFVTHDMDEAVKIADQICIMRDGKILQYDTPENILKNPKDEFVSNFVGKNRIWSSPEYIKVGDIMIDRPVTAPQNLSILKCIDKMRKNKVDSLLIINPENREFLGIVKASHLRGAEEKVQSAKDFMELDVLSLSPEQNMLDALKIITDEHASSIPVVDKNNRLAGLVTRSSLVTILSQQYIENEEDEQ